MDLKPVNPLYPHRLIRLDDLCEGCLYCLIKAGGESGCQKEWPGLADEFGVIMECPAFLPVATEEDSWMSDLLASTATAINNGIEAIRHIDD